MRISKIIQLSTATVLIGLSLVSCKKDDNPDGNNNPFPTIPSGNEGVVNDYINSRKVAAQEFTFSGDAAKNITTDAGTYIYIPKDAFTDLAGNTVTGDVTFKVKEIYKKSDMVKSNRPTISDGNMLISGGEFSFAAYDANGDSLLLDDGVELFVQTPSTGTTVEPNMVLFSGEIDQDGQFNWEQMWGDSARQEQGVYFFNSDTLGWINIDKFYNATTTTITVNLGQGFTTDKALTFFIFKNLNSVLSPSTYYGEINPTNYKQELMPVGEEVTIVCLAEQSGFLYMASMDVTISNNATYNLTFEQLSDEEIDAVLESLD